MVRLPATWQEYQVLCRQRGDRSIPRIQYHTGEVVIRGGFGKLIVVLNRNIIAKPAHTVVKQPITKSELHHPGVPHVAPQQQQ
ncbi:hypothetical protein QUB80_30180 [Chlorogloeopsis sp. ULAP01]|uniref:hypothetical protein n=1 Tax=Chlorogloeopsis sp. ULAP01 TaxID=3056483 RepID=UPI0025AAA435|nr:hypothetical protein [Chlorogloeopsis sp. ULAP01]MDM9384929.1 hypothetical protein [Chlorogloeopsis sp. ULAP01]